MINPSITRRAGICGAAGALLSISSLLTGCRGAAFIEGGPEIRYLTSKPPVINAAKVSDTSLVPLKPGTHWEMRLLGAPEQKQTLVDVKIVKSDGDGSWMEIRKDGQLWRREVYRSTASGLYLTAMGEDNKPVMRLSPPVAVLLYPAQEGDAQSGYSTFRYANAAYSATSYSRVSALEKVRYADGIKMAYRIDTLVQINQEETVIKFPTIRWLVPGVGFVRRSFVDQGRPVFAELQKFTPAP